MEGVKALVVLASIYHHNDPEIVIYVPEFGFGTHRAAADLLCFWHASKLA
jgi:hypothetical protein